MRAITCGVKRFKRANPVEVKKFAGYDVDAVPPVGHKTEIKTVIDKRVMRPDKVVGGSGRINTLVEIDPTQIKRLTNSEVNDMSE